MGFPGSRSTYQHHVLRRIHKLKRGKLVNLLFVNVLGRLASKVKPGQVTVDRESGSFHLMADGAHRPVSVFGLQQVFDQPFAGPHSRFALRHQVDPGIGHAQQSQSFETGGDIRTHGWPPLRYADCHNGWCLPLAHASI